MAFNYNVIADAAGRPSILATERKVISGLNVDFMLSWLCFGADGDTPTLVSAANPLPVTLTSGDIELGAVELKNSTTDDRAAVIATTPVGTEFGLVVRTLGALTNTQLRATPVPVSAATPLEVTGTGTAVNDTPIASTNVSAYRFVAIQLTGTIVVPTVQWEVSNNGVDWNVQALQVLAPGIQTNFPIDTNQALSGVFAGPIFTKFFRARVTVSTGNVVTALALFGPDTVPHVAGAMLIATGGRVSSAAASDVDSSGTVGINVNARQQNFNPLALTWERQQSNFEATLLASAARTATTATTDQINRNSGRLNLFLNVSAAGAPPPSITLNLEVKDPVSGGYFTVWTSVAIATTGLRAYHFGDGASGGLWTDVEPFSLAARTWRVNVAHGNANSITYSLAAAVALP